MRQVHTYTAHFDLETRQHELLGVDLGEGPLRRALIVGVLAVALWTGTMLLVFGLPRPVTLTAYLAPPILVTVYGTQRDPAQLRRWRLTGWVLAIRYIAVAHRPVINAGRRAASRGEWLPLRERLDGRADALAGAPGLGRLRAGRDPGGRAITAGAALRLDTDARLYGPDRMLRVHRRTRGVQTK